MLESTLEASSGVIVVVTGARVTVCVGVRVTVTVTRSTVGEAVGTLVSVQPISMPSSSEAAVVDALELVVF